MFEKPQYLTPDGYRRMPRRPKPAASIQDLNIAQQPGKSAAKKKAAGKRKTISKEAAQIIALAIKSMLNEK